MILKLYVICTVKMRILQTKKPTKYLPYSFFSEGLVLEAKASIVTHPSWVFMTWLYLYIALPFYCYSSAELTDGKGHIINSDSWLESFCFTFSM